MSRYADKLFWIVMAIIVLVITFLSYVTFFYQTSPVQSTVDENGLALKQKKPKEIQNLYVCADGAKIMLFPKESSKTIRSAKQGDHVAIVDEKDGWLEVQMAADKMGWIEKKYVCDQPPKPVEEVKTTEAKQEPVKQEQKTPPPPPATKKPEPPKATPPQAPSEFPPATSESIDTLVDGLFERVNQRTQMQFGQALFDDHTMLDSGMRLEARATSVWKIIPQNYKAQVLQILTNQYTLIACNIAKVVTCTPNNTPAISIVDSSGHEIAYQNSSGSQILE
jgi:hypothetical protein